MRSLASWSGIMGVASSILAAALGGLQFSDYSHVSQYLSEAYAAGTPYGHLLRYFLLVPSGALIMVFGLLLGREFRHSRLLWLGYLGIAVFYGLSMAVGSVFPCDAGCNRELETPSWSHVIHLTSGALTHAFVPGSLLMIAFAARKSTGGNIIAGATFMAAAVCAVCNTFLAIDPLSPFAGLFQRGFEGSDSVLDRDRRRRAEIRVRAPACRAGRHAPRDPRPAAAKAVVPEGIGRDGERLRAACDDAAGRLMRKT